MSSAVCQTCGEPIYRGGERATGWDHVAWDDDGFHDVVPAGAGRCEPCADGEHGTYEDGACSCCGQLEHPECGACVAGIDPSHNHDH